jgi:hypothetical protein
MTYRTSGETMYAALHDAKLLRIAVNTEQQRSMG